MTENIKLGLLISASGGKQTVAQLLAVQAASKKIADEAPGIARLSEALGITGEAAKRLSKNLQKTPDEILEIAGALQAMRKAGVSADQQLLSLAAKFGLTADQAKKLQAINFSQQQKQVSALGGGVAELAFKFNNVVTALQSLLAAAKPAYDFLIGSNERLNAQLLSSQTNLASATRIFQGGQEVTDPTAKIKATLPALEAALKQVERDTQSLVGVTSQEVNELFQITLTNAAALNNQSKQFADPIAAATSLTKGWAASLKVVGVPLDQARQEINSILKGQIDQNSILAKNLNISNQQVQRWQSQGVLVDELNKRLETFVAGNAIAARSISGIGSNIQDIFERLGRDAGKPFLEPIIAALDAIFRYLQANEQAIIELVTNLGQGLSAALSEFAETVGPALLPIGQNLEAIAKNAGGPLLSAFEGLVSLAAGLIVVLSPIAQILSGIIAQLAVLANSDFGGVVVQALAATAALGKLGSVLAGVIAGVPVLSGAIKALSTTTLPGAIAAMGTFATKIGTSVGGAVTALATGGIPALTAALPGLSAALTTASAAALPLAAALLPIAGAVGVTFIVKGTQDLKNAQREIDALAAGTEALSDRSIRYAARLKALNDAQKANGRLTAEQQAELEKYGRVARLTNQQIDEQIAALRQAKPASEAQSNAIRAQINLLERQKQLLEKTAGGIRIQAKELEDLGTSYEQLAKAAENTDRAIAQAQSTDEANKAAKERISILQQQQELGRITDEQAVEALAKLAENTKLEVEIQQQAQAEIGKIRKNQLKLQLDDLKAQTDQVEAAALTGVKGPVEAAAAITRLKKEQLDLQLKDVQANIAAETAAIAAGRGSATRLKELQAEQKSLQAEIQTEQINSAKRVADAQIKVAEDAYDKTVSIAKGAEIAKNTETAKLVAQGAINVEQAEGRKLAAAQARIAAELQAERIKAEALSRITAQGPEEQKKLEKQRRDTSARIQQLEQEQANNQIAIQKNALDQITADNREAQQKMTLEEKQRFAELAELEQQGVLSAEAAAAKKTELTEARLRKELQLEQDLLAKLQTQPASQARDEQIIQAQQRIADKRIAIVEASSAREVAIRKAALDQIERANKVALDQIELAAQERLIQTQRLVNQGVVSEAEANKIKTESQRESLRVQLAAAQQYQAQLQTLEAQAANPKAKEEAENATREARKKTNALTLQLLEAERSAQQAVVAAAQAAIQKQLDAKNRAFDAELRQIAQVTQARRSATAEAEIAAQRESAALEATNKALDRQTKLLQAKAALQQATNGLAQTETQIGIDNLNRAAELRKQLDSQNLSAQERIVIERQLAALGIKSQASIVGIVEQRQKLENKLAEQRRAALLQEQAQAQASLTLEAKRNELANNRAVVEARIAEIKAKAAVLDAQSALNEQRIASEKEIAAAQAAVAAARQGGNQADIVAAQAQLKAAETTARLSQQQAQDGVALARQQADLAAQNTAEAIEQKNSQAELEELSRKTLATQQEAALKQFEAAESARAQAQQLELARASAEGIAAAAERTKAAQSQTTSAQPVPRRTGGPVGPGTVYEVSEAGPEMYRGPQGDYLIPDRGLYTFPRSGRILNAQQTAQAMGNVTIPGAPRMAGRARGSAVVDELRALRSIVESRSAGAQIPVTFGSPDSKQWDEFLKLQRSLLRGL
jgi:hypothetical protein